MKKKNWTQLGERRGVMGIWQCIGWTSLSCDSGLEAGRRHLIKQNPELGACLLYLQNSEGAKEQESNER